jgi:RND superfamily putative drug exporter
MTTPGLTVRLVNLAAPARTSSTAVLPSVSTTVRLGPALGYVVLEDNSRFEIDRDFVVGRAPDQPNAIPAGVRPVRIEGLTGGMSRVHMEIRRVDGQIFVVDLGSRNGVLLRESATHGWTRLAPWQPSVWRQGAAVRIGCRTLRFERG